jgi:hypothetical protein
MPCINCTSAVDTGGSFALVFDDRTFVRLPGAPGCTTTDLVGAACCAAMCKGKRAVRIAAITKTLAHIALTISVCPLDEQTRKASSMTAFIRQTPYLEMRDHYMHIPK